MATTCIVYTFTAQCKLFCPNHNTQLGEKKPDSDCFAVYLPPLGQDGYVLEWLYGNMCPLHTSKGVYAKKDKIIRKIIVVGKMNMIIIMWGELLLEVWHQLAISLLCMVLESLHLHVITVVAWHSVSLKCHTNKEWDRGRVQTRLEGDRSKRQQENNERVERDHVKTYM